jgi:hypothetical protein
LLNSDRESYQFRESRITGLVRVGGNCPTRSDTVSDLTDMAKYDWQKIKEEYIHAADATSRPTLEELAAKYGCAPSHLREKAGKEQWKIEAERYLETVADKRQEQKSTALASDLAEWDAKCYNAAKAGIMLLSSKLQGTIDAVKKGEEPPSFSTVDDMAKALGRLHKIGQIALGEKEDAIVTLKIDYARLTDEQLERIAAGENPRDVIN